MKKASLFFVLLFISSVAGCATTQTSSGFSTDRNVQDLPEGIPKRVGVALFTGEIPINVQATDQFTGGLPSLGFDVVEREHFDEIIREISLHQAGLISEKTRKRLGEQLGLEAIFVGSVTGESSIWWVDSHLNLRLIDIGTGKAIWSVTAKDPRLLSWSMDVRTSVVHTTNQALKMLKKDLDKLRNKK